MKKPNPKAWRDPTPGHAIYLTDGDGLEGTAALIARVRRADGPVLGHLLFLQERYGFNPADPAIIDAAIHAAQRCNDPFGPGFRAPNYSEPLRWANWQEAAQLGPLVYYMRVGDRIKIGFTTNLRNRIAVIGPEEVMAVELGGREVEQERHRQFRHLHSHLEWFRYEHDLVDHVEKLRAAA